MCAPPASPLRRCAAERRACWPPQADKEAVPFVQNEEWWAQAPSQWLESAGTSTPHPDLAKNFWWQRPHRLGGLEPTEFLELASGRKAASEEEGAGARFVYLSKAVGNETRYAALHERMSPFTPLLTRSEREAEAAGRGAVKRGVNLWVGSPNASAPLHYDLDHNVHVQVAGAKAWTLLPPEALLRTRLHPLAHPSQRQAYPPASLQPPTTEGRSHPAAQDDEYRQRAGLPKGDVDVSDDREAAERWEEPGEHWARPDDGMRFVAQPGDVLCLPAGWLHSVRSLGRSDALGAPVGPSVSVTRTNTSEIWAAPAR